MNSIWSHINRALFVVHYKNEEEIVSLKNAVMNAGLIENQCEFIFFTDSKQKKS